MQAESDMSPAIPRVGWLEVHIWILAQNLDECPSRLEGDGRSLRPETHPALSGIVS